MTDLLSVVDGLLRQGGYRTRLTSVGARSCLYFEDDAILGAVLVYVSPGALLTDWPNAEREALTLFAPRLRVAGDKAWNVYCCFLCDAPGDPAERRQVSWIEENLDRTRKLAATNLGGRPAIVNALLPLLPLQYAPAVQAENVTDRLKQRIAAVAPSVASVALDDRVPADQIAAQLMEAP